MFDFRNDISSIIICGHSSHLWQFERFEKILRILGTDSPSVSGMDDIMERIESRMIIIATFG